MISRETRRLRRVFEQVLVLSAAGGAAIGAYACSSGSSNSAAGFGDASTPTDASSGRPDGPGGGSDSGPVGDVVSGGGDGGCDPNTLPDALFSQCCEPAPPFEYDAGADVAPTCEYHATLQCGLPSWVHAISQPYCVLEYTDCLRLCIGPAYGAKCRVANGYGCDDDAMAFVAADGQAIQIECDKCGSVGRRPAGLARPRAPHAGTALGRHFASAAHLEAASVHAFERLAEELEHHGASRQLARAARRSARDEVRHARDTSRLARRFGGDPPSVRVGPKRARTLVAVALENAVEGCVRETFGALLATHQARCARDAEIRRVMRRIAVDETRHAALAWAIAREIEPRLDDGTRRRIARARARAVSKLRRDAAAGMPGSVACAAGLPGVEQACRMVDELSATLWA
jgi:rubrerythrin